MSIVIRRATSDDLEIVTRLFDAYRRFYRASSDLDGAREFVAERLDRGDSVVLLAFDGEDAVGFTQLYPSFSSISMARIYVLNDLFVAPEARERGAGSALLTAASEFGRAQGAVRLTLSTEVTNTTAQAVYERLGWKRDTSFYVYNLAL